MTPIEPIEISAGRLHLRPWLEGDATEVLRAFTEREIATWQSPSDVVDVAAAHEWIRRRNDRGAGTHASFAIVDATTGALLGSVSLHRIDPVQQSAAIGYWTLPEARGRGIASHAVDVVSRWAFGALGLERIELCHAVENPASCRVADNAGYVYEGTLRQGYRYADGARHDEHLHARLSSDAPPPQDTRGPGFSPLRHET
jgi:RimJ/RimL family protein N-acetyltransferase